MTGPCGDSWSLVLGWSHPQARSATGLLVMLAVGCPRAGAAGLTPAHGPSLWPGLLHAQSQSKSWAEMASLSETLPQKSHSITSIVLLRLQGAMVSLPRFKGRERGFTSWEEWQGGHFCKVRLPPIPPSLPSSFTVRDPPFLLQGQGVEMPA